MKKHIWDILMLTSALVWSLAAFTGATSAQERTVEEKEAGAAETRVDTRNSTVAYIEGDHLVVRLEDGRLEAMRIPSEERFNIEGQKLSLQELKPGMVLTDQTISTSRPVVVKTVEIHDGTVWYAGPTRLVVRTHAGKMVDYRVPEWATVKVSGEVEALHQLKRGDHITATITTEEPMTIVNRETSSHGHHPVAEVETSQSEPASLTEPETAASEPAEAASTADATEELPATASQMPLLGLLGLLALGMSAGLRLVRKLF
jgi:LPXTG cell wall anchor motif